MKTLSKALLCVCGLALFPLVLSAAKDQASSREHQLPLYEIKDIKVLPEVVHQVAPPSMRLPAGTEIEMRFTIDEKGIPKNIRTQENLRAIDHSLVRDFVCQMRFNLSVWRFAPALDSNNKPVAVKVRMPVRVLEEGGKTRVLAALVLDEGSRDHS